MIVDEAICCSGKATTKALELACYKSFSIGQLLMRFTHGWTSAYFKPKQTELVVSPRSFRRHMFHVTKGMQVDLVQTSHITSPTGSFAEVCVPVAEKSFTDSAGPNFPIQNPSSKICKNAVET
jgi:hypothetical protein